MENPPFSEPSTTPEPRTPATRPSVPSSGRTGKDQGSEKPDPWGKRIRITATKRHRKTNPKSQDK